MAIPKRSQQHRIYHIKVASLFFPVPRAAFSGSKVPRYKLHLSCAVKPSVGVGSHQVQTDSRGTFVTMEKIKYPRHHCNSPPNIEVYLQSVVTYSGLDWPSLADRRLFAPNWATTKHSHSCANRDKVVITSWGLYQIIKISFQFCCALGPPVRQISDPRPQKVSIRSYVGILRAS